MRINTDTLDESDFDACFADEPTGPIDPAADLHRGQARRRRRLTLTGVSVTVAAGAAVVLALALPQTVHQTAVPAGPPPDPAPAPISTYLLKNDPVAWQVRTSGVLEVDHNCLYLDAVHSTHRQILLLPQDSYHWNEGQLVGPDKTYQVGDSFAAGGIGIDPADLEKLDSVTVPKGCDIRDVGFRVQVEKRPRPQPQSGATS
ncbi:MAG: hypothetical protein ACRYG2_33730 [Janthinobacterium lividum]